MSTPTRRKVAPRPKPKKPHKDYPLFPHASGQWAKKIQGKLHYFGAWADPQAALERYVKQKDNLLAGLPPTSGDDLTIRELVNRFLTSKKRLVESGELAPITWDDYDRRRKKYWRCSGSAGKW